MADNSFNNTVESLFKGMDSFITTKTVVLGVSLSLFRHQLLMEQFHLVLM